MTERIPAEAFHPSEFVIEEAQARGWTRYDLIDRLEQEPGFKIVQFQLYLEGLNVELGEDGAARLSRVFGTSPEFFLNLERAWLKWKAAQSGS